MWKMISANNFSLIIISPVRLQALVFHELVESALGNVYKRIQTNELWAVHLAVGDNIWFCFS
jgi:hypothetical protein